MNLTSSQWSLLSPLIGEHHGPRRRGRPSQDARAVLDAIFWIARTGARWADLPSRFPPYQTCHRRFRTWLASGLLFECLRRLATDLEKRPAADEPPPAATEVGFPSRSWRRHTALLLQSPLGRLALSRGMPPSDSSVPDLHGIPAGDHPPPRATRA